MRTIYDVINKPLRTALVAVLVFYLAFPVSGFVKPQKAEAIAPALAVPVIFGSAVAAYGVYVAGTTAAGYSANLNALSDGFSQATENWSQTWADYVSAQGSYEQAMQSAVTSDGNISLQTLTDNGFFDSVSDYTAYCVDSGTVSVGETSTSANTAAVMVGDVELCTLSDVPFTMQPSIDRGHMARAVNNGCTVPITVTIQNNPDGSQYRAVLYIRPGSNVVITDNHGWPSQKPQHICLSSDSHLGYTLYYTYTASGTYAGVDWTGGTAGWATKTDYLNDVTAVNYMIKSDAVNWSYDAGEIGEGTQDYSGNAVVTSAVVDGTAVAPTATVQPFEPTAEQLEAGFSALDVVAANTGDIAQSTGDIATDVGSILSAISTSIGGALNDIKTGVNGLESAIGTAVAGAAGTVVTGVGEAVGALGDVVGDISTTLDNVWNGAQGWWADVLAWLGATPLAQLIAQIIAAINAGVLSLDGAISAIQEWIGTAVLDIVGAIEAIQIPTIPEFEFPPFFDLEENPSNVDGSASVSQFNQTLHDKAPFAYMFAFNEGFTSVSGYSDSPHFRVRHTFELFDWEIPVDINAEPYLLYDLGGTTPAYLLRMAFSLTLCMGVLYASYRLGLRAIGGGGE